VVFSPARHTPPLNPDFVAGIDEYMPAFEHFWSIAKGKEFKFDPWQHELLRRVTELLPDGTLRWRSVLISCPRQVGKTELLTAIGLFALLRKPNQFNIGIASKADQARILYNRLQQIIYPNADLKKIMRKNTETRGIKTEGDTVYDIRAAKADALQGIPVSIAIVDEVHLVDDDAYFALVAGQGAREDSCVYGITTAGNEDSVLLANLYANAEKAIAGELPRFGAWIWEASEAYVPKEDDELMRLIVEANPSIQDGRKDAQLVLAEARMLPDDQIIRYYLNRFVNTSKDAFIPFSLWLKNERGIDDVMPTGQVVFGIDRSPGWEFATVAAAVMVDGIIHTELVASIVKPTLEKLMLVAQQLHQKSPRAIIMDGKMLKDLHSELVQRGINSELIPNSQINGACSSFYARLTNETLKHAPDPLLSVQIPRTVRKVMDDGFRISRRDSSVEIDAVMATLLACHGAETLKAVATRTIMV
jgi:phage terminase large subunit-like protein